MAWMRHESGEKCGMIRMIDKPVVATSERISQMLRRPHWRASFLSVLVYYRPECRRGASWTTGSPHTAA